MIYRVGLGVLSGCLHSFLSFTNMDFSPYRPSPDDDRRKQQERQSKGKSRSSKTNSSSRYEPVSTNSTTAAIPGSGFSSYQAGTHNPSLYEQGFGGDSSGLQPNATVRVNKYETRLPIRVDIEAALTYVLGPITGKTNSTKKDIA